MAFVPGDYALGHRRTRRGLFIILIAAGLVAPSVWFAPSGLAAGREPRPVVEVRSTYPAEFGLERPAGIAHDPVSGDLLISGIDDTAAMPVLAIHPDGSVTDSYSISGIDDPSSITFDPTSARLVGTDGGDLVTVDARSLSRKPTARSTGRHVGDTSGSAVDPTTGDVYVLAARGSIIQRISAAGDVAELRLRGLPKTELGAIAFNPEDGRIHVATADGKTLLAIGADGAVEATYDLSQLAVADLESITFAPSADHTDAESVFDLYLIDGGATNTSGRIVEVSLSPLAATAPLATSATLVRTTALSTMAIPSPDSSGVAWIRHQGRLLVVDSEVNEMPWLFNTYATNVFPLTYGGSLFTTQVGNTVPWTKEPTGVTYIPTNTHIVTSDDDADKLYQFNPGPDGRYATSDDTVTNLNIKPFANLDAEDVAYDTATGDLWVIDGVDREVFRYKAGSDGKFGTTDDPPPTNWDVGVYGAVDPEGIAHYEADDTLMVLDSSSKKIYVLSKSGSLIQTISITAASSVKAAGLGLAPPSDGSSGLNLYIVDRGVDNNVNPNENDGKLYEMSAGLVGGTVNLPPLASAAAPPSPPGANLTVTASTFPVTASLDASGSSDPENGPLTYVWTKVSGPAATIVTPTAAITSVDLTAIGTYQFMVTVTDSGSPSLSTTASVSIIVEPPGGLVTFQAAVAAGSDDAEETVSNGNIQLTSTDLDMVLDGATHKSVGMRFTNVTIPKNATISSASIQFRADEAGSTPVTLTVSGEAADDPKAFTSGKYNLSSRARTAATVAWSPPSWTTVNQAGPDQRTADLTAIVQELVNRSGWASGNAMAFFVTGPASGTRVADALEGGYAPVLTITYSTGGPPVNQPPVASAAAPPSPPGADLTVTASSYPVTATLDASGSYDPEGGSLTYAWTKTQGSPGETIISPSQAVSQVQFDSPGSYTFEVLVTDNGSPALSSSATVKIIVQSGSSSSTFQAAVATESDDAEETVSTGNIQLTSTDLDMVLDGTTHKSAGMRFTNVTIPKNATITSALIQFRADEAGSTPITLTIAGQAADNPGTFTTTKYNLSSRARTAATVAWSPPSWTTVNQAGPDQRTADLTAIVQELVNRSGWASGNAMAFFVTGPASGTRVADALEGGYAPVLTITYTS